MHILIISIVFVLFSMSAFAQDHALVIPCPDDLQSEAVDAIGELNEAVNGAVELMEDQDFNAQNLAVKWLGARNQDDVEDAVGALQAAGGLAESVAFLCLPLTNYRNGPDGPTETIAFVYQSEPVIHLYGNFFDKPKTGESSMVGTLLHELMHLHFVQGANLFQDEVYNPREAIDLAKSEPEAALNNAQSYAFFLEALVYGAWSDVN